MTEQNYGDNQNTNQNINQDHNIQGDRWFSFLYRTRVKLDKGDIAIMNFSLIFVILATISAPWVAVVGVIVALVLGYRFSIEKNANGFASHFQEVVKDAAGNVKAVVDSVVKEKE